MKFKITIKQIIEQEYEMVLENDNVVEALDEARELVDLRNKHNNLGQFFVSKVEKIK